MSILYLKTDHDKFINNLFMHKKSIIILILIRWSKKMKIKTVNKIIHIDSAATDDITFVCA